MPNSSPRLLSNVGNDLISGGVVFLVAIPLCLGIALASGAPLFSGLIAGIIGGILVGALSGSHTSVSGPAAGLSALVLVQIASLGSFELFLTALVLAGIFQAILGILRTGYIAAFFPVSVIKGLLFAIGAILILKQIPHLVGYDSVPVGDDNFHQYDENNTLYSLVETAFNIDLGASLIGFLSLAILLVWDKAQLFKKTFIPGPLIAILISVAINAWLRTFTQKLWLNTEHLVQVPIASTYQGFLDFLVFPDWSGLYSGAIYQAAFTLALVASLETLLNLEAVDKIDPKQRVSPPSRELAAQGVGNIVSGLLGGLPITSVIVRSSVNINMGGKTKLGAIFHGVLILFSVLFFSSWINQIPLASLAAILLVTGWKLANPQLVQQMWTQGKYQFLPFAATVIAIIASDLLVGVVIGLGISLCFILYSNLKYPFNSIIEKYTAGDEVHHITLPSQVGFFHKPALEKILKKLPKGGHALIDAENSDYVDPDIIALILDFQTASAQIRDIKLSTVGFEKTCRELTTQIHYRDVHTKETQESLNPWSVLQLLVEGNTRFREGRRLLRYIDRQLMATASGQFPLATVLSCIDSRTPAELIFDLSLGDIFNARVAGNVVSDKTLASLEFGCAVAGSKLIVVMGHTSCGAVKASVDLFCQKKRAFETTQCDNLDCLINDIQISIKHEECTNFSRWDPSRQQEYIDTIAKRNVQETISGIRKQSKKLDELIRKEQIAIVGSMYNIATGDVSFFDFATGSYSLSRTIASEELKRKSPSSTFAP